MRVVWSRPLLAGTAAGAACRCQGTVEAIARVLRSGEPAMFIMSGLCAAGAMPSAVAGGICEASGAGMMAQTSNNRIERGAGRVPIERVPYPVDLALKSLAGVKHLILVGAVAPVGLLRLSGEARAACIRPTAPMHVLARPEQDGAAALVHACRRCLGRLASGSAPVAERPERWPAVPD